MYCEKCHRMFEVGERCPVCRSRKVRQVRADDMVFLLEEEAMWAEMIADVLTQNDVPFATELTSGSFLALAMGPHYRVHRFLTPYECYEKARGLADSVMSAKPAEAEQEDT